MADELKKNDENEENEQSSKSFSQEEVENIVKKRIKNIHLEKEQLAAKLADLQNNSSSPSSESPASMASPPSSDSITPIDAVKKALNEHLEAQKKMENDRLQEQRIHQFYQNHIDKVGKMANDEKFKKLAESTSLHIPTEVAVHLSNHLNDDMAKKIFTELMSNENSHLKMKNAFLTGKAEGSWDEYDKWLKNMITNNSSSKPSPEVVPDLGSGEGFEGENSLSNVDDYINSM